MLYVLLILIAVIAVLAWHAYKRGPLTTWQELTALVGAVAAAIAAFVQSFQVPA